MIQITPNVYVDSEITECNLGCITTKDGIVMVDTPGNPLSAVKWRKELEGKGPIRYVINTEEHADHCSGSWFFPGTLISSQTTREKVSNMSSVQARERSKRLGPDAVQLMESFEYRLADIAFDNKLELHLGELTFELFPLPGHSPGGIGVYIPQEQVVFTTDCVFSHLKSWLQEAEPTQWFDSLKKLETLDVKYVVPGHGGMTGKEYLAEQSDIVHRWVEIVQSVIKQGLSLEEAIATIVVPDPYPLQPGITFISAEELNKRIISRLYQIYSNI